MGRLPRKAADGGRSLIIIANDERDGKSYVRNKPDGIFKVSILFDTVFSQLPFTITNKRSQRLV